jgi:hypothetical protein
METVRTEKVNAGMRSRRDWGLRAIKKVIQSLPAGAELPYRHKVAAEQGSADLASIGGIGGWLIP